MNRYLGKDTIQAHFTSQRSRLYIVIQFMRCFPLDFPCFTLAITLLWPPGPKVADAFLLNFSYALFSCCFRSHSYLITSPISFLFYILMYMLITCEWFILEYICLVLVTRRNFVLTVLKVCNVTLYALIKQVCFIEEEHSKKCMGSFFFFSVLCTDRLGVNSFGSHSLLSTAVCLVRVKWEALKSPSIVSKNTYIIIDVYCRTQ